jgi:hypothetical protein
MQPPQLARAFKPRRSTKPILETLPSVSCNELRISSIYRGKPAKIKPLKIPNIEGVKVGPLSVEFHFRSLHRGQKGRTETFRLKSLRGIQYAFLCNACGRAVIKLYHLHNSLLCRFCCNGRYASQAISRQSRPVLEATRIQSFLDNKQRLFHKTQERLRKRLGEKLMRAQRKYSTDAGSLWD